MIYVGQADFEQTRAELVAVGLKPGALLRTKKATHFWALGLEPLILHRMHDVDGKLTKEILHGSSTNLFKVEDRSHLLFLGHVRAEHVVDHTGTVITQEYRILTFLHEKTVLWWWFEPFPGFPGGAAVIANVFEVFLRDQ